MTGPDEVLDTAAVVNWERVESEFIDAVSYDKEKKLMLLCFAGGAVYEISPVDENEHKALMDAPSKGRHYKLCFNTALGHTHRRLDRAVVFSTAKGKAPTTTVSSPMYLALLNTKKAVKSGTHFMYALWSSTGREPKDKKDSRYLRCLALVKEAGGGKVGPECLDGAIQLAKKRGL